MRSTARRSASSSSVPDPTRSLPTWVLVDTNAFFLPLRTAIDLRGEVARLAGATPLGVTTGTLAELDRLVERGLPDAAAARALARRLPRIRSRLRGDPGLVEAAARERSWVVTGDRALRAALLARGVTVLEPRSGSRLLLRPAPPAVRKGRARATVMNGSRVVPHRRRR